LSLDMLLIVPRGWRARQGADGRSQVVWLRHADARQVSDLPASAQFFRGVFDPAVTDRSILERLAASLRLAAHQSG